MFTATGIGAKKNADNTVTLRVQVTDDRDSSVVFTRNYTARSVIEARGLIQVDLQAQRDNETDQTLNAAVIGQVLGSI